MKLAHRLGSAAAIAAVALAPLGVAAPAQAVPGDTTYSFAPTAVVEENSCIDHAFTYSVEFPPQGVTDWTVVSQVVDPSGDTAVRKSFGSFSGSPNPGSNTWQLCGGFDEPGTYTVVSTTDYRAVGASGTTFGTPKTVGTIQVVKEAKSKVALKAKRKGPKITAKATVSVSTGGSYGPVGAGGKVTFQKKVGRKWKKVDTAVTDAAGVAKGRFKGAKGTVIRAVFAGAGTVVVGTTLPVPPATSKAIRVR